MRSDTGSARLSCPTKTCTKDSTPTESAMDRERTSLSPARATLASTVRTASKVRAPFTTRTGPSMRVSLVALCGLLCEVCVCVCAV